MARADFDKNLHRSFFKDRSTLLIHEIGILCPCRTNDVYSQNIDRGQHRDRQMYCSTCGGLGVYWVNATKLKGLWVNVSNSRNLVGFGDLSPGDAIIGLGMHHSHVSQGDKITLAHTVPIEDGQLLMRNSANMGKSVGIESHLSEDEDRLWYRAGKSIYCADENGVVYTSGTDFELNGNRIIKWVGNRPSDGINYTIKYEGYLEYIIFQPPMDRKDRDVDLGQKVAVRLKHVHDLNLSREQIHTTLDDLKTSAI